MTEDSSNKEKPVLYLHQFDLLGDDIPARNASNFCMKMELYLRVAGIPYENKEFNNDMGPKNKIPFITFAETGERLGDTTMIIERLEKDGIVKTDLDKDLTPLQKSISSAFTALVEDKLYFVLVYFRWIVDRNWDEVTNPLFFKKIPFLLNIIIPWKLRKATREQLYQQGLGRHSKEEITKIGNDAIDALSDYLGEKEYFLGTKNLTKVDITLWAILVTIFAPKLPDFPCQNHFMTKTNLIQYMKRITVKYFPEESQKSSFDL